MRSSNWLDRIAPRGSRRRQLLRLGRRALRAPQQAKKTLRKPRQPRWLFAPTYSLEDNSQVILYTDNPALFPDYIPRRPLTGAPAAELFVSLIATGYNEADTVEIWLNSLLIQTRVPDEIILVDGGSNDGTLETLQDFARRSPIPCQVFSEPGANIARGRNLAIQHAQGPVIACTDFGCRLDVYWLERLVTPFGANPHTQVVGGWFATLLYGEPVRRLGWANLENLDPQDFLPSSRSIAYRKDAWEAAGGYPEWLTLTGEDTYFSAELKRQAQHWAFVPEAIVDWETPPTPTAYWQKLYLWSIGDGESGAFTQYAWWTFVRIASVGILTGCVSVVALGAWLLGWINLPAALGVSIFGGLGAVLAVYRGMFRMLRGYDDLVWELGAELPRLAGFLRGWRQRPGVTARRLQSAPGVVFILAVVPIDDTGGGARSAQLAHEFLRLGYVVVYINRFPKYESIELGLATAHPNLITADSESFQLARFQQRSGDILNGKTLTVIVELPEKDYLPLVNELRDLGGIVVYDLLDDWDTSLGAAWYDAEVERRIIARSQVLVATAPHLADRLAGISSRPVHLLPNAVNHGLFNPHRIYQRPDDLPQAEWIVIYIGALWGDWFDWVLLRRIGEQNPEAAVVVIGDYTGQCPDPPTNVHFLGLKPQRALPTYLAHAKVAIVPWKINAITQATSPLKVYEYLAMRKPVVAPDITPLAGTPGVYLARDPEAFLAAVRTARDTELPAKSLDAFIQENNWQARVEALLKLVQDTRERSSEPHNSQAPQDA